MLFSCFAVARTFTDAKRALTSALLIVSMPPFVYHAALTKNDSWLGAAAITLCVLGLRYLQKPNTTTLWLLLVVSSFGVSVKATFLAFGLPYAISMLILLFQRGQLKAVFGSLRHARWKLISLVAIGLVHSQIWLYLSNLRLTGGLTGPPEFAAALQNQSGPLGPPPISHATCFKASIFCHCPHFSSAN